MEVIGLSGYARSGKDTAAQVLVEQHGFTRVAFADKLREVLYALNPVIGVKHIVSDISWKEPIFLSEVIDEFGWNGYKETIYVKEIRRLLQRLGTEAGRQTLWDSIWVDAAFDGHENEKIVVTDCRFPNEAQAIKERGGSIWRINRTGVDKTNNHISETALDDWAFDIVIGNDASVDSLHRKINNAYKYSKVGK